MLTVDYLGGSLGDALDTLKKCKADCPETGGCTAAFQCTKALREIAFSPQTETNLQAAVDTLLYDPRDICGIGYCIGMLGDLIEMQEAAATAVLLQLKAKPLVGLTAFTEVLDRSKPWTSEDVVLTALSGIHVAGVLLTQTITPGSYAELSKPFREALEVLQQYASREPGTAVTSSVRIQERAREVGIALADRLRRMIAAASKPTPPAPAPPAPAPPAPEPSVSRPTAPQEAPADRRASRTGLIVVTIAGLAALGTIAALRIRREAVAEM